MAHILTRKYGSGNTRHTAVIRIRRGATVLYREAKTFAHRSAAITWARHREVQLEDEAQLTRAIEGTQQGGTDITLAALIRWYIDTFESISKWQRSKQTHLEFLERHPFSSNVALRLNVSQLVNHVKGRRADGAGPATVCNDLVWIGVVLRAAKSVKGLAVQPSIVQEARTACRELRLIAKAKKRDRRLSPDAQTRLREYFGRRDHRADIPRFNAKKFRYLSGLRIRGARVRVSERGLKVYLLAARELLAALCPTDPFSSRSTPRRNLSGVISPGSSSRRNGWHNRVSGLLQLLH
jgi:hypothetical protein